MTHVICPEAVLTRSHVRPATTVVAGSGAEPRARRRPHTPAFFAKPFEAWRTWAEGVAERRRIRADVLEQIPLVPGEHVLSILCDVTGNWVVSTERSLYRHADNSWLRTGWEQVTRVNWDDTEHTLELAVLTPQRPQLITLQLTGSTPLVDFARERVASTILLTTDVSLGDKRGARVRARRA
ncbi:hypothetical protein, partial [Phytoactinopolyspora endophytica]|uniref:hypothetical protein n=1 Tax=Phytoactinopolyspora endophytica TaxID=1642495 RepID=UPI0013E9E445